MQPRWPCTQLKGGGTRLGRATPTMLLLEVPRGWEQAQLIKDTRGGRGLETSKSEAVPRLERPSWRHGCSGQRRRRLS